jgi:hypothetical protein
MSLGSTRTFDDFVRSSGRVICPLRLIFNPPADLRDLPLTMAEKRKTSR